MGDAVAVAAPVSASMAPGIPAKGGYTLRWRAASPVDGSDVSGVIVSKVTVEANDQLAPDQTTEPLGSFMLVPGPGA